MQLEHVPACGIHLQAAIHPAVKRMLGQSGGVRQQQLMVTDLDQHRRQPLQVHLKRIAHHLRTGIPAQPLLQPTATDHRILFYPRGHGSTAQAVVSHWRHQKHAGGKMRVKITQLERQSQHQRGTRRIAGQEDSVSGIPLSP
ncbi:hypothetical protein D3C84_305140 [compost metagenome]